jgi:hypothetical protein
VRWARWAASGAGPRIPGSAQRIDLRATQPPRTSLAKPPELQRPEADPLQRHDPVPDRLDHPTHLPIPPFAEDDLDLPVADLADLRGRRGAVLQLDTLAEPREFPLAGCLASRAR